MIALIQRVAEADVAVGGESVGAIGPGILALIGVERGDTELEAQRLAERVLGYRIFPDAQGKMNLSLVDMRAASCSRCRSSRWSPTRSKGTRPSFSSGAPPDGGQASLRMLRREPRERQARVATGRFGADMQVSLVNDGPVTFWLQVRPGS